MLQKIGISNGKEREIEEFIARKQSSPKQWPPLNVLLYLINEKQPEPYISITPKEMATVMGHDSIVALLDDQELKLSGQKQITNRNKFFKDAPNTSSTESATSSISLKKNLR